MIAEAMTWLRTPYHMGQAVKGAGADCALFPLRTYEACGVLPQTEVGYYAPDWHMHRNEEAYLDWLVALGARPLGEKLKGGLDFEGERPKPGDFGIWKFGRTYSHGAILTGETSLIHAYVGLGVTLDDMAHHEELRVRPARFFSMWRT